MNESGELRSSGPWRGRVNFIDGVTYGLILIFAGSAVGLVPRMISITGLIMLVIFPIGFLAVLFWIEDMADWFAGLFFEFGCRLYYGIWNARNAVSEIQAPEITKMTRTER